MPFSLRHTSQVDTQKEQNKRIQAASMHAHEDRIIDCMHCLRIGILHARIPRRCSHPSLKAAVQQNEDTATSTTTDNPSIAPSTQSFLSGSWISCLLSCERRGVSPSSIGMLLSFIIDCNELCPERLRWVHSSSVTATRHSLYSVVLVLSYSVGLT